ncbi:MAG: SDR family oxidoreductase [Planctomycetota bacterium]|nr:SDR family oxidoreductase [Planctomycetota bacterium]
MEKRLRGNALVTGGAGFIGSHLVEALLEEGCAVRVVDDFSSGRRENLAAVAGRIELLEGDMSEPEVAGRACEDMDWVLHEAAIPSVPYSVKNPAATQRAGEVATLLLLEACVKARVRRVTFAASSSVYGDTVTFPSHEDLPARPLSPYAASKAACEGYIRAFARCRGLDGISLRYFNVFGPRQDPASPYSGVISIFLDRMMGGKRPVIFGDGLQTRDFVYVGDVVRANLLALKSEKPLGGAVCNVGTGKRISILDLVAEINRSLGTSLEPEFAPPREGDARHTLADLTRAREILGYEPAFTFEDGMRRLIRWLKDRTS